MTKRACPFEVDVLRQFKIHINNSECDKSWMMEIQRETIEKLYSAQRKNLMSQSNINNNKKRNFLQKHVDNYFSTKSGKPIKKSEERETGSNIEIKNCSYCDKKTEYVSICSKCMDYCCQNCSFADYNVENDETRVCITCS